MWRDPEYRLLVFRGILLLFFIPVAVFMVTTFDETNARHLLIATLFIVIPGIFAVIMLLNEHRLEILFRGVSHIKCLTCKISYNTENEFLMHICKNKI